MWAKKIKHAPKWGCSPTCDHKEFFFNNQALTILNLYGALTSCKTRQVYNGPQVVKFISTVRKKILVKNDFSDLMGSTLPKLHVKLQPHPLKIF